MEKYLVTSSSSLGLNLYDEERNITLTKKIPGKLKYNNIDIYIGDYVIIENDIISSVLERKNFLNRPKISNIDFLCIIVSLSSPDLSTYLLDSFLTFSNMQNLKVKILFTKQDLISEKQFLSIKKDLIYYKDIGYDIYFIDNKLKSKDDFDKFLLDIRGKKSAFVGQTGVGKSTILNRIDPSINRAVDSKDIVTRGRHTTKDVSLIKCSNGFIFDTPGFSSFELKDLDEISLSIFFPGFKKHSEKCKFVNCLHLKSTVGCNIINMINDGRLSSSSYENYLKLLSKIKEK